MEPIRAFHRTEYPTCMTCHCSPAGDAEIPKIESSGIRESTASVRICLRKWEACQCESFGASKKIARRLVSVTLFPLPLTLVKIGGSSKSPSEESVLLVESVSATPAASGVSMLFESVCVFCLVWARCLGWWSFPDRYRFGALFAPSKVSSIFSPSTRGLSLWQHTTSSTLLRTYVRLDGKHAVAWSERIPDSRGLPRLFTLEIAPHPCVWLPCLTNFRSRPITRRVCQERPKQCA